MSGDVCRCARVPARRRRKHLSGVGQGIRIDGRVGEQFAQGPEQFPRGMRWLGTRAFVDRVAGQLPQVLSVGVRALQQQPGQRDVALVQQPITPAFDAMQQRGFASSGFAAGVQA